MTGTTSRWRGSPGPPWWPRLAAGLACAAVLATAPASHADEGAVTSAPVPQGDESRRSEDVWFRTAREAALDAWRRAGQPAPARNLILFLGDGMGVSTVTAARIFAGQQRGEPGEENTLSFETFPHLALVKTYNTNQQVPDSAGTMTAILSGVKTKAGVLGVDDRVVFGDWRSVANARVPTLFEEAESAGLGTGIVTTTRLTHATPAAAYAHAPHRLWESDASEASGALRDGFPDLARQFVEFGFGDGIDVTLAGGRAQFLPAAAADPEEPGLPGLRLDGRDLMAEWQGKAPGRVAIWKQSQLDALDPAATRQILGLFDPSHMEYEVDRASDAGGEPSLSEMTALAIDLLSKRDKGFVLLVEGGRIDHGHHANNAYRALSETVEFAKAVEVAMAATRPQETLIVVTADHSHPLTHAGYVTRGNPILGHARENTLEGPRPARDGSRLPYTSLNYTVGPGHPGASPLQPAGPKRFPHLDPPSIAPSARPDLTGIATDDPSYLQEAMIPRYSGTHSGEDVAVYATGPGAALFHGVQEQHFLYHAMVRALGPALETPPRLEPEPRDAEE